MVFQPQQIPDRQWECRFVGDPTMEVEITSRGIGRVEIFGLLDWNEMKQQIANAWAVTLPTRADTSPNTVKESRVIGVPVISTVHGGQMEYLRDRVNGRIVDPLGAGELACALSEVMASFESANRLGKGRHSDDREYLRPERTADSFAEIYRELAIVKGS